MAIRSKEFIEIAEGIRSHEVLLKSKIESLEGTLTGLHHSQSSLEQRLSSLFSELHMVSSCSDEDDLPDYAAIARVEMEISGTQAELAEVNDEITVTELELSQTQDEYDEVEEEKQQTLFEIEQRAQISAQNISVVSGMYGAYADVGASLQQTFQSGFDSLVQASRILGGNISAFQGSSQGGSSHSPGSIGSTSRISGSVSTGTGKTSTFISGANSAFSGKPSSNSFMSGQIAINHPSISTQQSSAKGTSVSSFSSLQSSVAPPHMSGLIKQGTTNNFFTKQTSASGQTGNISLKDALNNARAKINSATAKIDLIRNMSHDDQVTYFGGGDEGEQILALLDSNIITNDKELSLLYKEKEDGTKVRKTPQELAQDGIMTVSRTSLNHAMEGDYIHPSKPYPKGRLNGGGHSQKAMLIMNQKGIQYHVVKTYSNGVRIGYVENHKSKTKNGITDTMTDSTGHPGKKDADIGQSWFPANWTEYDIRCAGTYVANKGILRLRNDGKPPNADKYAVFRGVNVGIYPDSTGQPTTIYPDNHTQPNPTGGVEGDRD